MREPTPLPLEARRAAWTALWRILLAPPRRDPGRAEAPPEANGSGGKQEETS